MKKNSFIAFIISLVIVGIVILFNYIGIQKESTLICIRDDDKIVFSFNENGISKITKNGKSVSDGERKLYNMAIMGSFAWNKMSDTYSEIIKKHMNDVANYEKERYNSYCDFKEN